MVGELDGSPMFERRYSMTAHSGEDIPSSPWTQPLDTERPASTGEELWWLAALQEGDEDGLRWLLRQYGTWIYSKAYRMLGSHEDAEEAWQDIFMRVWQKIDLWDP
jgi:hypothetical protein